MQSFRHGDETFIRIVTYVMHMNFCAHTECNLRDLFIYQERKRGIISRRQELYSCVVLRSIYHYRIAIIMLG